MSVPARRTGSSHREKGQIGFCNSSRPHDYNDPWAIRRSRLNLVLDEAWDTLDSDQKLSIASELHSYINQLRHPSSGYIGAIDRGKAVIIGQIASIEGGPFDSEQQFNEFILGDIVKSAPDILRHYAKFALMDDHEIVFTHADFFTRNILVEGGRVTANLYWEYAGWYPEHWEYIQALRQLKPMPDWPEYLSRILPPRFEREYILPSSSLTPLADITTMEYHADI
ncbi:hypothetical protein N7475_000002 [Penicillium sp. IBT 31633x]|nr:hypothetical protein N7475_000002 [Penicillium sp. IBT 31633x]